MTNTNRCDTMGVVADEKLILKKGLTKYSVENILRKLFLRNCSLKTKQTKTSTIKNLVKQVFTSQRKGKDRRLRTPHPVATSTSAHPCASELTHTLYPVLTGSIILTAKLPVNTRLIRLTITGKQCPVIEVSSYWRV